MKIFYHKAALDDYLKSLRQDNQRIGLVPTMGALHKGHLALLAYVKPHCDVLVCSVFVNPTQFNNQDDLEKYPRPVKHDLDLLRENGCDVVFMPTVEEMYDGNESWEIDLGELDKTLEGAFRPGHYQGVTQIVKKLFDAVKPNIACFGQKDYQQYLVIKKMVELFSMQVKLLLCPTVREKEGLALSSRNVRLSERGKQQAQSIAAILNEVQTNSGHLGVKEARRIAIRDFEAVKAFKLEYFEICYPDDLKVAKDDSKAEKLIALVAVWLEGVRLIDNVIFDVNKINNNYA